MAVYKFRLTFEDYEDIYRDIEIKSSQTFFDLHEIILQSIGFDMKHAGSFFASDDFWRKGEEVTLLEEDLEPGVRLMKKVKISSLVIQPNQRFIYLYDKQALWSFQLELIKLIPEDAAAKYPRCIKSIGQAPKQYKPQLLENLKKGVEEDSVLDKLQHEEPDLKMLKNDEKLVFDEGEVADLHEDENDLVPSGDDHEEEEQGEEGEENEHDSENHEEGETW
jgi:hypothetical protein